MAGALSRPEERRDLVRRVAKGQPSRVARLAESILAHWSARVHHPSEVLSVQQGAQQARGAAKLFLERLHVHVGSSPHVVELLPEHVPRASAPPIGSLQWLSREPTIHRTRTQPQPQDRVRRIVDEMALERVGTPPAGAIVCPERAYARVREWRSRRPTGSSSSAVPPIRLVQSLIHDPSINGIPTAVGSPGDHYWLVHPGRWVTPHEVMGLFAVPDDSPVRSLLSYEGISPRGLVQAMGRALHPRDAERALRVLLQYTHIPVAPRYASACSGIDLFAVAMDQVMGVRGWRYVAAAERDSSVVSALVHAWAPRGLRRHAVMADARDQRTAEDAPYADVWFCSPPCEAFSRRNHSRSDDVSEEAARDLDAMLSYPRYHRPRGVIVENVDEVDACAVIAAALRSLHGYRWVSVSMDARDHGPMARRRRFWIGWREGCVLGS